MDILKIAGKTVSAHNMLSPNDRVLIGLSGGADSTALLYVMLSLKEKYNLEIACAHVNHGLRDTADRDMIFARDLCEKLGVRFFSLKKDIRTEAKECGKSEELYAREVRYDFFESLGYDKIATAHNKNDVAETLLFNFMRGAQINGLSGIPYVRGNIIRPLLDIKKGDIESFCEENGYDFVTDETNLKAIYSRNKIRLEIIPKIEKDFNPSFVDVVTKNASYISEDAEFLDKIAEEMFSGEVLTEELGKMEKPIKRRVLELFWKESTKSNQNLSADYIEDILSLCEKNHTGKVIHLPCGFIAKIQYGKLIISKKQDKFEYFYSFFPEQVLKIPEIGKTVLIKEESKAPDFYLDKGVGLVARSRVSGDVFCPVKMNGTKKLSDFFTDRKMTEEQRNKTPIIICDGKIVAVGTLRFSREFQDRNKTGYKIEIKENRDV